MSKLSLINNKIQNEFLNIVQFLELDYEEVGGLGGWSSKESKRIVDGDFENALIQNINTFLDNLGLSLDSFYMGSIDYFALEQSYRRSNLVLPEKYSVGAFGNKRTVNYVIEYISKTRGALFTKGLLKKLQVAKPLFENDREKINNTFYVDLLDYLTPYMTKKEMYFVGLYSFKYNKSGPLLEKYKKYKKPSSIYEHVISDASKEWDENFIYRIKRLKDDHCIIQIRDNPVVKEALEVYRLGSRSIEAVRRGLLSSFSCYGGHPPARIKSIMSTHSGDQHTEYYLEFLENEANKRIQ